MRKTYLDNIRWITVAIVVIYHTIYMFNGSQLFGVVGPFSQVQYQDMFLYIVYPWFMLLLFVVSGMSARYSLNNRTHKEFITKSTVRYLVPSTIGLFVIGWVQGYYNMQISNALESLSAVPKPILFIIMAVSGTGPLWYIQMLWLFSLLLVLFRVIFKDRLYKLCAKTPVPVLILFAALVWGASLILNVPVVEVYRFGIYGVGYFIGYLFLSHDEVMDRLEKWWILLSVLGVGSGIAFLIMYWGAPYANHVVLDTPMCNVYAWFATIGIIAFMKKWGNFSNKITQFMNKKSWGIYVFHYLFLSISAYYLNIYKPNIPVVFYYLIVLLCSFVGALLLYEIISRIPVIRWCILGIKKEKKENK